MGRFAGRAAITWSSTGDTNTERVHLLDVPLRELRPAHSLTHFTRESLDKSTIETFTLGSGAHELVGAIRYDGNPQSLMDLIVAGSENRTLTYYPDLNDPDVSYACLLVAPRSPAELSLDPQRGMFGDQSAELRLRRTDESRFHPLYVASNVLFWYRAGDTLSAATFTRADSGRYYAKGYGAVTTASTNIARIEYHDTDSDGVRETPSLLLEAGRTNLCLRSETLDNASWTKSDTTISADAATAPDGVATADAIVEAATTATHYINQTFAGLSNDTVYTFSVFLKAWSGRDFGSIETRSKANALQITYFDISTGAIGTNGHTNAFMERLASGWYRCSVTRDVATGATTPEVNIGIADADNSSTYLGDVTKGIYAWGAQVEAGIGVSAYIPTTSASVARAVDQLSFPFVARPQAMTVYARFVERGSVINTPVQGRLFEIGASSPTQPLLRVLVSTGYRAQHVNLAGTSVTTTALGSTPAFGQLVELAVQLSGVGAVTLLQSINGGAVSDSGATSAATLAQTWSDDVLWLNSVGTTTPGLNAFLSVAIVRGIHDMVAMRRIAKV